MKTALHDAGAVKTRKGDDHCKALRLPVFPGIVLPPGARPARTPRNRGYCVVQHVMLMIEVLFDDATLCELGFERRDTGKGA